VLSDIINPIENYENIRYIHKPYTGITSNTGDTQCDIWFYFYFLSGGTYVQDYTPQGISSIENELMLKQSTESFFRLEFYKTPGVVTNNVLRCQPPTRVNRKLAFSRNLSLPLGEKMFYNTLNGYVHVPVFNGNNYRNKENMYLYWFEDESVLQETNLSGSTTGNTFFMTAKFYNAKEGTIIDFANNLFTSGYTATGFTEATDMYFQVDIDKINHTYVISRFVGTTGTSVTSRVGTVSGSTLTTPITFFEKGGGSIGGGGAPPVVTPTMTPTKTPLPTPTPSVGAYSQPVDFTLVDDCDNFGVRVGNMSGGHNQFQGTALYFSEAEATGATFFNIPQIQITTGYVASRIQGNLYYASGTTMYVAVRDLQTPTNIKVKSIVLGNCPPPTPPPPPNPGDLYTNTITLNYISSYVSTKCEAYTNCTWG
jgi:hypothetical protein